MPCAAIWSGLSQMRIANVRSPRMSARCTPLIALSLRLHDADQIVGDLVLIEVGRGEAEIQRRELRVGVLDLDDRRLGFGRKVVADLRDLRLNLRQRVVGVVVELAGAR